MAKLNFGTNSLNNTPSQIPVGPNLQNSANGKKVSIDNMITKLNGNNANEAKEIKTILNGFKGLKNNHKNDLEYLLGRYDYLDKTAGTYPLLMLISDLKSLNDKFKVEEERIKNDAIIAQKAIIPTEYLTESDMPFFDHIKDKIEDADNLSLDELVKKTREIKIESNNLDKKDWDKFFDDLRDGIKIKDLPEFDKMVKIFKENSDLYLSSSGEYNSSIPTQNKGVQGLVETGLNIVKSGYDYMKGIGGLDIEKIGLELDNRLNEILLLPDANNGTIGVDIGGIIYQFTSKKEAIKTIYKAKMVLNEISKNSDYLKSFGFLSTILTIDGLALSGAAAITAKGFENGTITGVIGLLLSAVIMSGVIGANAVIIGGPIESIFRNIKDVLATRFGDKGWSGGAKTTGSLFKNLDNGIKNNKIPLIGGIIKSLRLITAPAGSILNFGGAILEKSEKATIESLLRNERINVVDGLFEPAGKEVSTKQEMQQRIKILDFYKKKWKYDTEKLAKLETLVNPSKLVVGGQLNSLTETFYLKLYEIDKGHIILTNKGIGKIDKFGNIAKGTVMQTLHVFSFPNFKEKIFAEVNQGIKQYTESLKELFTINELDNGKIEIGNKTPFCIKVEGLIDLDGTISNIEELKRNELLNEYIDKIKSLEIQEITPERVKQDLILISEGYLPKYKLLELLKKEFDGTRNKDIKSRIQKFMDKVFEGKWVGNETELKDAIIKIKSNTFNFTINKEELRDDKYIDDKLKKGAELLVMKYELDGITSEAEFLKSFDKELKMNQMLKGLSSIETIKNELKKLFKEIKGGKVNGIDLVKNDFTIGHLHYIVRKIMEGKTYDDAKKSLNESDFKRVNTFNEDTFLKKLREDLLLKMEKEIVELAKETDVGTMQKKLKEFQEKYKIDGDLEVYMKEEGVRYNKIIKELEKLNNNLELDLKQFVEKEGRELKGKAVELIEKAKLTNPNKSAEISALIDKVLRTKEAISIVQFENALKAVMYGSNAGEITITDIRSMDFNNYSLDSLLSNEAKEIKLNDIVSEELEIKGHEELADKKVEITFVRNSGLVELVNNWNEYIIAEDRYEKQILETKKLEGLKTSLLTINTEIENINNQVAQLVSEQQSLNEQIKNANEQIKNTNEQIKSLNKQITETTKGSLKKDIQDKINGLQEVIEANKTDIESLKAERESIKGNLHLAQSEIIAKKTNKLSIEKEIRDLIKYEGLKVSDLDAKLVELRNEFKINIEVNPVFKNYIKGKGFNIDEFKFDWVKGFMKDLKRGKFIR